MDAQQSSDQISGAVAQWVHQNPWFRVGLAGGYYFLEPRQAQVMLLPRIGGDVVLVRAHRPLLGGALLELPAGCAEPGETPVEAARRELREETGITVSDLARFRPLPPLAVSPDRIPRLPHLFEVALTEEEFADRTSHDAEVEEVLRLDPAGVRARVLDGELRACLPMAMLFRHFVSANGGMP